MYCQPESKKELFLRMIFLFILMILSLGLSIGSTAAHAGEVDIVKKWCPGEVEVRLEEPFGMPTRVDCISDGIAYEADWGEKWAEAIGQSLYYAERTGLRPGILLILKEKDDIRYLVRLRTAIRLINGNDYWNTPAIVVIERGDYE